MTRTKSGKYKFEQLEDNSMTTGRFNGVGGWKVDVYRGRWVTMGEGDDDDYYMCIKKMMIMIEKDMWIKIEIAMLEEHVTYNHF